MSSVVFTVSMALAAVCLIFASGIVATAVGLSVSKTNTDSLSPKLSQLFSFKNTMVLIALGFLFTSLGVLVQLVQR